MTNPPTGEKIHPERTTSWGLMVGSLRSIRPSVVVVTAAPAVAFVAVNALSSLHFALIAAGVAAIAAFGWRLARRESTRHAVIGLLIAGVCAAVAAATGEARGFFLLPTLFPIAVIAVCLVTVLIGRPLTGLLLNRVAGGPPRWYAQQPLRRVHTIATLVCAAVNVVNATMQVTFYLADNTAVLAAAHIATGPVFAVIVAATITAARRITHPARAAQRLASGPKVQDRTPPTQPPHSCARMT